MQNLTFGNAVCVEFITRIWARYKMLFLVCASCEVQVILSCMYPEVKWWWIHSDQKWFLLSHVIPICSIDSYLATNLYSHLFIWCYSETHKKCIHQKKDCTDLEATILCNIYFLMQKFARRLYMDDIWEDLRYGLANALL